LKTSQPLTETRTLRIRSVYNGEQTWLQNAPQHDENVHMTGEMTQSPVEAIETILHSAGKYLKCQRKGVKSRLWAPTISNDEPPMCRLVANDSFIDTLLLQHSVCCLSFLFHFSVCSFC